MNFLIYTAEPTDDNATLDSFGGEIDRDISRMMNLVKNLDLERVTANKSVNLLADAVNYDEKSGIVTADVYKQTNPKKAFHQLAKDGDGMTVKKIISEHDDAFIQGTLGMMKINDEIQVIVEEDFGSFFVAASKGMDITPLYSSEAIQSIQDSESIGETTLDFNDDYNLTASLFQPPNDGDVREEHGFGNVDVANNLVSLLGISRAHRMSLDIDRDEWLNSIPLFQNLINSGLVTTIRVEDTKNGIVKLGEGEERAVREQIKTSRTGKGAVKDAFANFPDDI